jgi:hypothetical protein
MKNDCHFFPRYSNCALTVIVVITNLFCISSGWFKNSHPLGNKITHQAEKHSDTQCAVKYQSLNTFFPSRNLGFIVLLDAAYLLLKRKKLAARWVELL